MKNSRTQRPGGVYNRGEKANRRGNEKVTVHWESILDRLTYFVNLLYIAPWDTDTIRKRNHHCSLRLAIAKVLLQTLIAYCSAGGAVFSRNAASECICSQILTVQPAVQEIDFATKYQLDENSWCVEGKKTSGESASIRRCMQLLYQLMIGIRKNNPVGPMCCLLKDSQQRTPSSCSGVYLHR